MQIDSEISLDLLHVDSGGLYPELKPEPLICKKKKNNPIDAGSDDARRFPFFVVSPGLRGRSEPTHSAFRCGRLSRLARLV